MVKDHSDSVKGNLLLPHRLLLSINSKGSFICTMPDRITHTTAFVTPVVLKCRDGTFLTRMCKRYVSVASDGGCNITHPTSRYRSKELMTANLLISTVGTDMQSCGTQPVL